MARSGRFSGGLRPFGGGTLDANAAFILPEPPAPTAPPARVEPPPRGTGQAPQPVIPKRPSAAASKALARTKPKPVAKRKPVAARPGARRPIARPKPVAKRPVVKRAPPKPPVRPTIRSRVQLRAL